MPKGLSRTSHGTAAAPNRTAAALLSAVALTLWCGRATAAADAEGALATPQASGPPAISGLDEARSLLRNGRFAESESLARRLIRDAEAEHGVSSIQTAQALDVLVEALWRGGKAEDPEAQRLGERAVAIKEAVPGPDHLEVATSLVHLGIVHSDKGDYPEAESAYRRALAIRERTLGPAHPDVAKVLNNLGVVAMHRADYTEARALFERALAVHEKAPAPDSAGIATSLANVANVLANTGDYAAARPLLERALAMRVIVLGPEHPYVAAVLTTLAGVVWASADDARAKDLYERALAIQEKVLGPSHPARAHTLNGLAAVLEGTGDYAAARPLLERALDIRKQTHGSGHPHVAEILDRLGDLHFAQGDVAKARPLYERALAIREEALGPQHPDVARSLDDLARMHLALSEPAGALEAGLRAEAIGREHLRLTARALAEREALRYAAARPRSLDPVLTLTSRGLDAAGRRSAWDALVRSRALVLDEMAARHRATAETDDAEISRLANALRSARVRLAGLAVRGPGDRNPQRYHRLFDEARGEKERAERALAELSVLFRRDQERSGIGLAEVVSALPAESALVAFARYQRLGPGANGYVSPERTASAASDVERAGRAPLAEPWYLAFVHVAGSQEPLVVELGPAAELDSLVSRWSVQAGQRRSGLRGSRGSEAAYRAAGGPLRERLWDPLAPHLKRAQRVFLVPDGSLHLVSFAALPVGEDRYLVESGPLIHYLSAERDLAALSREDRLASKSGGLLALGAPDFDVAGRFTGGQATRDRGQTSACADFRSLRFDPLPASDRETREVVALWHSVHARGTTNRLTGVEASEAGFKGGAPGKRVVHLATHGFFLGRSCPSALDGPGASQGATLVAAPERAAVLGENPLLFSGLALAGANQRARAGPDAEDGILTAEEIAALDLRGVDWAVLSACETGAGEVSVGEGVLGLRRAFQVAGVQTVIMSLWGVGDEATRQWMRELYRGRLLDDLPTAEAAREASRRVLLHRRQRGLSTHPSYWAGFIAAGDWR
jgi:CHAT domain-containing protein/tetratricopeptide (TPR) repeat protein